VTWTVSDPSDWEVSAVAERRQRRLCRLAEEAEGQGGSARILDFAAALSVSERTIKRDIADLRSRGTTVRTRKSS
jgi:DeoR/GlpR family transcriptional regulator of sugar metabolism